MSICLHIAKYFILSLSECNTCIYYRPEIVISWNSDKNLAHLRLISAGICSHLSDFYWRVFMSFYFDDYSSSHKRLCT